MDPEATGQVSDAPTSEVVADSAPAESTESTAEFSFADAFAAAKAEQEAAATPSEDSPESSQPEGTAQPPTDPPQPSEAPVSEKPVTTQGALDRIQTLVAQGRESDLTPEERGVYNRVRDAAKNDVLKQQAEEKEFRQTYLDFLRLREEDPDAFAEKVVEDPDIAAFMRTYRTANPDVSLENPDAGPRPPSPDEVRADTLSRINDGLTDVGKSLAAEYGVDFDAVSKEAAGKFGTLLTRIVDEAVKAGIAKELPNVKKAEREAATLEAQALYANKTIVVPKVMGSGVTDPTATKPNDGTKDANYSMRQAAEDARRELALQR